MAIQNVIIAGGGSGAILATALCKKLDASKYNLILINNRPSRIHLVAGLRMAVTGEGNLEDQAILPYDRIFSQNNGTFRHGTVTHIEKTTGRTGGEVTLEDGEKIPFAILVLATGSNWTGPIDFPVKMEEVKPFIDKGRKEIQNAKRITLVGAGAVGLELAGEIKDVYPEKEVTIVHGEPAALNLAYSDRFRAHLHKIFSKRGVNFVYHDRIDDLKIHDGIVTTRKGVEIKTELLLSTRGPTPNTAWIISSLGGSVASDAGFIKVTPSLQLPDHPDIFAMGDIVDLPEQKQIAKANAHAAVVAANIAKYLMDPKATKMKTYGPGATELIAVTNGQSGGAAYIGVWWGLVIGDWLVRWTKSKGLLVQMFKSQQGY